MQMNFGDNKSRFRLPLARHQIGFSFYASTSGLHYYFTKCLLLLFFVYHRIILSTQSVGAMLWLVNGPISKWRAARCSGQLLLMMWSAVYSGSPHSHAALSASPHFFMEGLYRPTPGRSLFRVVQCFRRRSSPLTPSPGSDTWRCTRVGPDASHSCFHVAAINASFDRSSGMTLR